MVQRRGRDFPMCNLPKLEFKFVLENVWIRCKAMNKMNTFQVVLTGKMRTETAFSQCPSLRFLWGKACKFNVDLFSANINYVENVVRIFQIIITGWNVMR